MGGADAVRTGDVQAFTVRAVADDGSVIDDVPVTGQAEITTTEGHISKLEMEPSDTMASRRALAAISGAGWIPVSGGKATFGIDITMVDSIASGR